jgi:epoxyqueuosine reductase
VPSPSNEFCGSNLLQNGREIATTPSLAAPPLLNQEGNYPNLQQMVVLIMLSAANIKQRALEVGFDLVGIAPPSAIKDLAFLPQWIKKGYGGEMNYLTNPKRQDPRQVLLSVKSILCVGLIYNTSHPYSADIPNPPTGEPGSASRGGSVGDAPSRGWISRYAWGKDYHKVMRKKLEQIRAILHDAAGGVETRVYVDTGPIVERAFARLSGIGWMGKNTCMINQGKGSWFFLGVILTNQELELDTPAADRCGTCTRCLEACPTGALVEPYVMDASRCISYFNIELRGAIPEEFRPAVGRNVFGCDICQDVCPWNGRPLSLAGVSSLEGFANEHNLDDGPAQRRAPTTELAEFLPQRVEINSKQGRVALSTEDQPAADSSTAGGFSLFNPTLGELASITEEDFKRVFARSPIKRVKYRGWLRNLCLVMGNSGDRRFLPWLKAAARNADGPVREHALWALRRLQRNDNAKGDNL